MSGANRQPVSVKPVFDRGLCRIAGVDDNASDSEPGDRDQPADSPAQGLHAFHVLNVRLHGVVVFGYGMLKRYEPVPQLGVHLAADRHRRFQMADLLALAIEAGVHRRPAFLRRLVIYPNVVAEITNLFLRPLNRGLDPAKHVHYIVS